MRKMVAAAAAAVVLALAAGTAEAGEPRARVSAPSAADYFSGVAVPPVTRLHPVIGSIQRHGRFTNPFTHKAKYTQTVYNPNLGTFGRMKFRQ